MKEKIVLDTNDPQKHETTAQTAKEPLVESQDIIDVDSDGEASIREDLEKTTEHRKPMGPAVDDEDPDYSPMDEHHQKTDNTETSSPGGEQSLDDVNRLVEEIIDERDTDRNDG